MCDDTATATPSHAAPPSYGEGAFYPDGAFECPVFEGAEKKLEVRFELPADAGADGMRAVCRADWDALCAAGACTIVSKISSRDADAFMLSESSLLVYPNRVIAKTCGNTETLSMLPPLLKLAAQLRCRVARVIYSRSDFLWPDKQPAPYQNFDDERAVIAAALADAALGAADVVSHVCGPMEGTRWHVCMVTLGPHAAPMPAPTMALCPPVATADCSGAAADSSSDSGAGSDTPLSCESGESSLSVPSRPFSPLTSADGVVLLPSEIGTEAGFSGFLAEPAFAELASKCTLEMTMNGLDQANATEHFWMSEKNTSAYVTRTCGLSDVLGPDATVDAYMFEPCGYSMNALSAKDEYYSVHVTPQNPGSFASFETSCVPARLSYPELLAAVLRIFKPSRFAVSLTCTAVEGKGQGHLVRAQRDLCRRVEERLGPQISHRDSVGFEVMTECVQRLPAMGSFMYQSYVCRE